MTRKLTWGEDRVFYYEAGGRLKSLMTNVTDVIARDALIASPQADRAFRIDDLLELQRLLEKHKKGERGGPDV